MVSPENTNWLYDYGLIEDCINPIGASDHCNFSVPPTSAFTWPPLNPTVNPNFGLELDGAIADLEAPKENTTKKRARPEPSGQTSSKACREKLRRDRLNDKFVELACILEPGRPPKTDKAAILVDAVRMVTQLRGEAQKLKDSNAGLQDKIKELKAEKIELRDEKQKLKSEKERLEQQLKTTNAPQPGGFFGPPPAMPAPPFAPQGQGAGNKLVPVISYPGVAMWQFMPPAAIDTSQDHVLRPPVA